MPKYQIKTQPSVEPISLSEARSHLKNEGLTFDDAYVTSLIVAARRYCEQYCNRAFIDQVWLEYYDRLSDPLRLSLNPVDSIVNITYYDTYNALQTLASTYYDLDNKGEVAFVREAVDFDYPNISTDVHNPVIVEYKAGFGAASTDVPQDIRQSILLMIAYFYENREAQNKSITGTATVVDVKPPIAVRHILDNYRIYSESY